MCTKNLHFHAENHLPLSDLWYDQYPLRRGEKQAKNRRFFPLFARDATDIFRIGNRRTGGVSRHDFALISYASLCSVINSWKLNWQHSFGFFRRKNVKHPQNALAIKFSAIDVTTKWCIRKLYKITRRFTSRYPNCDAAIARFVAGENVPKTAILRTFLTAMRQVFVVSQIGEKEVILRVERQLFRIHHFGVA